MDRLRSVAPLLRPISNAARRSDAIDEALAQAGLFRLFDRPKYRQRNIIERMFGWLKEKRRIVTRFDKLAKSNAAMVSSACSIRCLRHLFSYRA
ncbi:Transposase DDE domain-containing protein [Pseudomonas putida]|jgi:transposase|nr:Transposase DDE domain-containing protein [Pseudomonas putida]